MRGTMVQCFWVQRQTTLYCTSDSIWTDQILPQIKAANWACRQQIKRSCSFHKYICFYKLQQTLIHVLILTTGLCFYVLKAVSDPVVSLAFADFVPKFLCTCRSETHSYTLLRELAPMLSLPIHPSGDLITKCESVRTQPRTIRSISCTQAHWGEVWELCGLVFRTIFQIASEKKTIGKYNY